MTYPDGLTKEQQAELDGTPELAAYRAAQRPNATAYPKPEMADIEEMYSRLTSTFAPLHDAIAQNRDVRYMRDQLPPKWQKRLKDGRRVHLRMSHNEILRVASMATRNTPKVKVRPLGKGPKAEANATAQQRWCQELIATFERGKHGGIWRRHADQVLGDGIGVLEFFITDAYEKLDLDQKTEEDDKAYLERTDEEIRAAGNPFGLRVIDPLAVMWDEEDGKITRLLIVEQKAYRPVFNALKSRSADFQEKVRLPQPGSPGWPQQRSELYEDGRWRSDQLVGQSDAQGTVLTLRYYDCHWYGYVVGGELVELMPHKLPSSRVPVFVTLGITTGSPNISEMVQGITWGMINIERTLNDLITLATDSAFTSSRAKPVVTTAANQEIPHDAPSTLDLSGDDAPILLPGQDIKDAFAGFQPKMPGEIISTLTTFYQKSGLNPIAQGQSPGADPAGYTVNSLTQAATTQYESPMDNMARTIGEICDYAREAVAFTVKEKVSFVTSVPQGGATDEEMTDWIDLSPDDVGKRVSPAIVTIDPLSDANRMAATQQKAELNKQGFIPRREVQRAAGADDPAAWDRMLIVDTAMEQLASLAIQEAMAEVRAMEQPQQPPSGLVGPDGQPIQSQQQPPQPGGANPAVNPAPPQPPAVGAQQNRASQGAFQTRPGPEIGSSSRNRAGQQRSVVG